MGSGSTGVDCANMFDSNRAAHCRGVAILMRRLAPALGLDANRMTLLGWIHDLGYLTGRADMHAPDLGRLLESEGYEYAGAVARHGTDCIDYGNPVDVLLNIADMSVNGSGLLVSFDERVRDVVDRWGEAHPRVNACMSVIRRLETTAEWETVAPLIRRMPEYRQSMPLEG